MPRAVIAFLASLVVWMTPEAVSAKPVPEGAALFGLSMWSNEQMDSTGIWTIAIETASQDCPTDAVGLVRIEVGPGADVVAGDINRSVHPSTQWRGPRDTFWILALKKTGDGPVRIRGSLRIPGTGAESYEYVERILEVGFEGSRVVFHYDRPIAEIGVKNGQRFRYGGEYPVAIDDDEVESPSSFESRPELLKGGEIKCRDCGISAPLEMQVVATVGKNGSVTWIRPGPVSGDQPNTKVWAAVLTGLRAYRFQPARSHGRPVADNAILTVRVVPSG
jgi:hypothetical protein